MQLFIKRLHPDAILPDFAHPEDAGMDLYAVESVTLQSGEHHSISTGVAVAIPQGYVGLIWEKSGVSHKRGVKTLGGVIDAGYRGEVFVGLINHSHAPQTFEAGNKIAQLLIQKVEHPILVEVTELDKTERGSGAFGSTGV